MSKEIKVLNLYCGIGGNRKFWDNVKVTAIENDNKIATEYKRYFPEDKVIITDAHKYLLKNYDKFDFIWSSPPCPSHSDIRRCGVHRGQNKPIYPEMSLYQEIIFLQHFSECKWVVENVIPYYQPLIEGKKVGRHLFWSNFFINKIFVPSDNIDGVLGTKQRFDFDISKTSIENKRQVMRNLINPDLGLHVLRQAFTKRQMFLE